MDSLIFELQIVFYFQLFLSANVRHTRSSTRILGVINYHRTYWLRFHCFKRFSNKKIQLSLTRLFFPFPMTTTALLTVIWKVVHNRTLKVLNTKALCQESCHTCEVPGMSFSPSVAMTTTADSRVTCCMLSTSTVDICSRMVFLN